MAYVSDDCLSTGSLAVIQIRYETMKTEWICTPLSVSFSLCHTLPLALSRFPALPPSSYMRIVSPYKCIY